MSFIVSLISLSSKIFLKCYFKRIKHLLVDH